MENQNNFMNNLDGLDNIFEDIESIPNSFFDNHSDDLNAFVDAMIEAPEMKETLNFYINSMKNMGYPKEMIKKAFDNSFEEYNTNIVKHSDKNNLSESKKKFMLKMTDKLSNLIQEAIDKTVVADAQIEIELINPDAKIPTYAHYGDAGADVYACSDITVYPGETKAIPLGLKVSIPFGWVLSVRPRSGMSIKTDMRVSNSPGTIKVA